MLDKLAAEFTKSRPLHSNDSGLAETKNGAVIRKHLGYAHIPQRFAAEVNTWCSAHLNPYINFHRPCLFAEETTDKKGKTRKRYPLNRVRTPFEMLSSLPHAITFLRPDTTLEGLRDTATSISDNLAAKQMNQARQKLFLSISQRSRKAA